MSTGILILIIVIIVLILTIYYFGYSIKKGLGERPNIKK